MIWAGATRKQLEEASASLPGQRRDMRRLPEATSPPASGPESRRSRPSLSVMPMQLGAAPGSYALGEEMEENGKKSQKYVIENVGIPGILIAIVMMMERGGVC